MVLVGSVVHARTTVYVSREGQIIKEVMMIIMMAGRACVLLLDVLWMSVYHFARAWMHVINGQ